MVERIKLTTHEKKEDTVSLAEALVQAQAEMGHPKLSGFNPHFKSKFAPLIEVKKIYQPVLAKYHLYVTHLVGPTEIESYKGFDDNGNKSITRMAWVPVTTKLFHAPSGECIEMTGRWPSMKAVTHQVGAVISYARRYQVCALLDIVADEDDDGNAGAEVPPRQSYPKKQPPKPAAKKAAPKAENPNPADASVSDADALASYITGVDKLMDEMAAAKTLDELSEIWKRILAFVKSGVAAGHLDKSQAKEFEVMKDINKKRLSDPHNIGDVEGDVPS